MNKHDYAGQTAVAGAKLLRAAKVATDATTPSQARTALREIASILDGMPGQDEMVSQLRSEQVSLMTARRSTSVSRWPACFPCKRGCSVKPLRSSWTLTRNLLHVPSPAQRGTTNLYKRNGGSSGGEPEAP